MANWDSIQVRTGWQIGYVLLIGSILVGSLLVLSEPVRLFDLKFYDLMFRLRGPVEYARDDIAIVEFSDQDLLESASGWPIQRSVYAQLINTLLDAQARLIVMNLGFYKPSNDLREDSLFASAIARDPQRTVLSGRLYFWEGDASVENPVEPILQPGVHVGMVNELSDNDYRTRRFSHAIATKQGIFTSLDGEIYRLLATDDDEQPAIASMDTNGAQPEYLINFYGPAGTIPTYTFRQVLENENNIAAELKDRIVYVGVAAKALQDYRETPYSRSSDMVYGTELHANILANMLDRSWIRSLPSSVHLLLSVLLVILLFAVYQRWKIHITLLSAGSLFLFALVTFIIFSSARLWIGFAQPVVTVATIVFLVSTVEYSWRQNKRKQMLGTISHYLSDAIADELVRNPTMLRLGGERSRLTVMFADIEGFTTISETMDVEKLVHLLNEYLSEMSSIILEHNGIIDKYEGDSIMAEWGVPVNRSDHSSRACEAALAMQHRLEELRGKWKREGKPELRCRIGINTGEMIVGNLGCLDVFDYTVLGDPVNLASRLEGMNKTYGTKILIGPETREEIEDGFVVRQLNEFKVKGRSAPVRAWELLASNPEDLADNTLDMLSLFSQGLEQFDAGELVEARSCFEHAHQLDPNDGPTNYFLTRCAQEEHTTEMG